MSIGTQKIFTETLKTNQVRFFYSGTIEAACDYAPDGSLLVHYALELPQGWDAKCKESLFGLTQQAISSASRKGTVSINFPFQFDLVTSNETKCLEIPKMYFEILKNDSWNRQVAVGYGFTYLPAESGCHTLRVKTWKPCSSKWKDNLNSFFLGIGPKLENIYTSTPQTQDSVSTRFPLQTEPSGTLLLNVNLLLQNGDVQRPHLVTANDSPVNKALEEILEAFQRAKRRLQEARGLMEKSVT